MSTDKNNKPPGFSQIVVGFFTSVRLTLFLLAALALLSFFGTTGREYAFAISEVSELKLNFTDVYHTGVYRFLLGMLFTNMLICSLDRLPAVIKKIRMDAGEKPPPPPREADHVITLKADGVDQALSMAEKSVFGKSGSRGEATLKAEKGAAKAATSFRATGLASLLGPLVTHLGVMAIIIGGLWGSFGTFEAQLVLSPGEESDTARRRIRTRGGADKGIIHTRQKGVPPEDAPDRMVEHKLDFAIRVNDFKVTFYEGSAMPSDYVADLSVLEGGAEVARKKIEVNQPLYHNGFGIYQSSYGVDPKRSKLRLTALYLGEPKDGDTASGDDDKPAPSIEVGDSVSRELGLSDPLPVPGRDNAYWAVMDYQHSSMGMGRDLGPSATVGRFVGEELVDQVLLFEDHPDFDLRRGGPFLLRFSTASLGYYTGLQIIKDPGLPVIWIGFSLLVIGVIQSFIVHHHRIWLVAQDLGGGEVELRLIGRSKKAKAMFEKKLAGLAEKLAKEVGGG